MEEGYNLIGYDINLLCFHGISKFQILLKPEVLALDFLIHGFATSQIV